MMNRVKTQVLAAQIATVALVAGAFDRLRSEEKGQSSAEYAGIIFVVVAIIAALVAFGPSIASAIGGRITEAVGNIGG
ncbi:hypothetical protein [Georgenia yuyongxinii]|uniref:Pilus assembly protein Flp/PilA n=1 Tax=Georgenia yuyongxinii TaxID=2589797 RepID=A0A552WL71_9MICO|nr:hypothetical protein [Georgenia yuyongxinii]TRW43525.1 hypothetical protein FJ693_17240 [Georgenia yuyongxinii]